MATYATVAELREYLSGDAASNKGTARFTQAINAAERVIDAYTRKPPPGTLAFTDSASATRYFDDTLHNHSHPIDDLLTVSAVTRNGVTISSGDYQLLPRNPGNGPYTAIQFSVFAVSTGTTDEFYSSASGSGYGHIGITGTWGFCTNSNRSTYFPEIEEATLIVAAMLYRKPGIPLTDMLAAMRSPINDDLKVVRSILEPFRNYGRSAFG